MQTFTWVSLDFRWFSMMSSMRCTVVHRGLVHRGVIASDSLWCTDGWCVEGWLPAIHCVEIFLTILKIILIHFFEVLSGSLSGGGASRGGGCQRLTVAHREVVHREAILFVEIFKIFLNLFNLYIF